MKKIYAPWRNSYVSSNQQFRKKDMSLEACVFCSQLSQNNDEHNLILKRYKNTYVVMNLYPYNAGHLMALPIAHKAELTQLTPDESSEIINVVTLSIEILKVTMKPQGFNVGLNIGSAGGGGIPSHLHMHIIPRWDGDTNFLATTADTKVICSDFKEVYRQLKPHFDKQTL